MNDKTRVLLVDDHAMLRKGMALLLGGEADIEVVGEVDDGEQAIAQARALQPDVVVMDINMPGMNGIEATRQIVTEFPAIKIIALSIHSGKRFVDDMLIAGASGYLLKESVPEELLQGIRAVMRGEMYLSSAVTGTLVRAYVEGVSVIEVDEPPDEDIGILQTKLHRPPPPLYLVTRTRLLERLTARRERPLALVSAPAGYGKSVLVSNWLESSDWSGAWLSLDESDSDLRQFLSCFVAGIQSTFAHACEKTRSLIGKSQLPSLRILAGNLANELEAIEQPFLLVLDDYHRIDADSPVNELLQQLLECPPIPLHLVILTRRDPPLQLLTLRAKDQITEIRMHDLGFTGEESRELLEKSADFTATDEALGNLQQVMEGWAVGLQLVSLALRRNEDPNQFLNDLHGGFLQAREYLIQEVISQQSPLMQEWLLKIAILNRFSPPLCDVVCASEESAGTPRMDSTKFIGKLSRSNLFVIPLDMQGEWFRYHHLFHYLLQAELKRRMSSGEIAALHVHASEWFESQGLVDEAIQHALKAGGMGSAADIFERHWQAEQDKDGWRNIEKWLAVLPAATRERRPGLLLAQAWIRHDRYQLTAMAQTINRLESLLSETILDEAFLGELNFFKGVLRYWEGKGKLSLELLAEAREQIPPKRKRLAGLVEEYYLLANQMTGQEKTAVQELDARIQDGALLSGAVLSRLFLARSLLRMLSGELTLAAQDARSVRRISKQSGIAYTESWGDYMMAASHFRSSDMEAALTHFVAAIEHRYIMHTRAAVDAMVGLALTYQAMQRPDSAAVTMVQLLEFARELEDPQHLTVARSGEARLALMQGDLESASRWLSSFDDELVAPSMSFWLEIPVITQARVLLASDLDNSLQKAIELLGALRGGSVALHNTCQTIEVAVLQSLALRKQDRVDEATDALKEALDLARAGRWIHPFIEAGPLMSDLLRQLPGQGPNAIFIAQILSAFEAIDEKAVFVVSSDRASQALVEPLTNRELDVLELLSQRLRNKEMAAMLFISPETIKTHLKNLYQKLGVNNRHEARAKAAEYISAKAALSRTTAPQDTE